MHIQQIVALEFDRQLGSLASRSASMTGRAGALLATAGIAGGLIVTLDAGVLSSIAVTLLVISALLGLAVLVPTLGQGIPAERFEEIAWSDTPAEALRRMNRWKEFELLAGEKDLLRRRWLLLIGFALLALSLSFVAVQLASEWEA